MTIHCHHAVPNILTFLTPLEAERPVKYPDTPSITLCQHSYTYIFTTLHTPFPSILSLSFLLTNQPTTQTPPSPPIPNLSSLPPTPLSHTKFRPPRLTYTPGNLRPRAHKKHLNTLSLSLERGT